MDRLEGQLAKVEEGFSEVVRGIPLQAASPLPADWLRCEMLERYQVLRSVRLDRGTRILEVGSGGHAIATVPLAYGVGPRGRVVAVERERWTAFRAVIEASRMQDRVLPVGCDARKLPFPTESFALAACVHAIRSLRSEENMVEIFREMLRVAPRIALVESLPIAQTPAQRAHMAMYDLREEFFEATTGAKDDLHYLPLEDLYRLAERAGGKVEESHILEIDLPHALAFFPRAYLERVPDPGLREDLCRRWDSADRLRQEHGTDHPPVALLTAKRG